MLKPIIEVMNIQKSFKKSGSQELLVLDDINLNANMAVADFIKSNSERVNQSLYVLSAIRKLERVGDQCMNIAEEIIFYVEAKVLKHLSTEKKS